MKYIHCIWYHFDILVQTLIKLKMKFLCRSKSISLGATDLLLNTGRNQIFRWRMQKDECPIRWPMLRQHPELPKNNLRRLRQALPCSQIRARNAQTFPVREEGGHPRQRLLHQKHEIQSVWNMWSLKWVLRFEHFQDSGYRCFTWHFDFSGNHCYTFIYFILKITLLFWALCINYFNAAISLCRLHECWMFQLTLLYFDFTYTCVLSFLIKCVLLLNLIILNEMYCRHLWADFFYHL